MTIEQILEAIESMKVTELNELVKAAEEKFGVSASAPVLVAGAAAGGAAEEKRGPHRREERQEPREERLPLVSASTSAHEKGGAPFVYGPVLLHACQGPEGVHERVAVADGGPGAGPVPQQPAGVLLCQPGHFGQD